MHCPNDKCIAQTIEKTATLTDPRNVDGPPRQRPSLLFLLLGQAIILSTSFCLVLGLLVEGEDVAHAVLKLLHLGLFHVVPERRSSVEFPPAELLGLLRQLLVHLHDAVVLGACFAEHCDDEHARWEHDTGGDDRDE